jgi:CDP-diacylglycerol--glycerol-3-phosphate 3-phosphatidyltransferase
MNLPNRITMLRVALAGVFFVFFFDQPLPYFFPGKGPTPYHYTIAFACLLLACISDWIDGHLARRLNQLSAFGAFWDPIADKILVTVAWIALVANQAMPAWIVVILLARDFAVSGLRMMAAEQGVTLAAETGGKVKTVLQLVTIGIISAHYALVKDWGCEHILGWSNNLPHTRDAWFEIKGLAWFEFWILYPACLLTSVYSGWRYFQKNSDRLKIR